MPEDIENNWMTIWEQDERIRNRIACPERGYPESEALYPTIKDWEQETGFSWGNYLLSSL